MKAMENGLHVTIDGKNCDKEKLKDFKLVYQTLNELPELFNFTKITKPHVVPWLDKGSKIPGISGFIMIAESHVSIHTFPEDNFISADFFSCQKFDSEKVINYIKEAFNIKDIKTNIVKRGFGNG